MNEKSISKKPFLNKIGDKFGKLTITAVAASLDKRNKTAWLCRCECGTEKVFRQSHLRMGTKSCGCIRKELFKRNATKHNGYKTITYTSWGTMKQRCLNPNAPNYKFYGGRGITICARWLNSFEKFLADIGERPDKNHSLDRINSNGNYEPTNCRWIVKKEQQRNKRDNRNFTINGQTKCLSEWCEIYNTTFALVKGRIKNRWKILDALTEPPDRHRTRNTRERV